LTVLPEQGCASLPLTNGLDPIRPETLQADVDGRQAEYNRLQV
jgi:hypothetical protein